jgi:DNA primase
MAGIAWDTIRGRHPLVEVARRTGFNLDMEHGDVKVCCPMPDHADRTPSMNLHLDTDRYHCFGCGASGDVIQWVRSIYGVPASEAIRILDQPGTLPAPPPEAIVDRRPSHSVSVQAEKPDLARTPRHRVLAAVEAAWAYYTYRDLHHRGVDYLLGRRIDVSALETEEQRPVVGHTPRRSVDQLVNRLRSDGYTDDELVDAGLARRTPSRDPIDTYRDRVIVPVRDDHGQLLGLIGRYTGTRPGAPKYLNPPRTITYDKAVALYRPSLRVLDPDGQVVVCEGTLDALAISAQAANVGLSAKYAPVVESGLAISALQWDTITAIHPRPPVLCADGDEGGRTASTRWAAQLAARGREACITWWPAGHDPASWLADHGDEGLAAVSRKGCLEKRDDQVRPQPAAFAVACNLIEEASARGLDAQAAAVAVPLNRLSGPASERYAKAAAAAIAAVVVADAVNTSVDGGGGVAEVISAVAFHGAKLPRVVQVHYVDRAAFAIEKRDLGPAGWVGRQIGAALFMANDGLISTHAAGSAAVSGRVLA